MALGGSVSQISHRGTLKPTIHRGGGHTLRCMANKERPEEVEARVIVERITGLELIHHDANGAADYITADHSTAALEVTTITNQGLRSSSELLAQLRNNPHPDGRLECCWSATVDEHHRKLKGIQLRIANAIAGLQDHNVSSVSEWEWATYVWGGHAARGAVEILVRDRVQSVERWAEYCQAQDDHPIHCITFMTSGGGSAAGSEDSLALIVEELLARDDNSRKLRAETVSERHLFAWLDDQTDFAVARPLDRDDDARWEHFGLPSSSPNVSDVDHLWVVHRRSRRGWHWTGEVWESVSGAS